MNQKEVNELRRRFRADKSAISRVYGCYVNGSKEIISYIDAPLGILKQEEVESYLARLKKSLSGALGSNLIDISFDTQQVVDSEEHRLLTALRDSQLRDERAREAFYRRVIDALDMDGGNYVILLAADSYDVPYRGSDDEEFSEASDQVFTYFVCAVCPVKESSAELRYFYDVNEFHIAATGQTVGSTALGFLFPAFDNRAANIYNVLYYVQKPDELHQEFIDAVFRTETPMSAPQQKNAFQTAVSDALEQECSYDVVQSVHEQLRERIERHKAEKDPEPLRVSPKEVGAMLRRSGVSDARAEEAERGVEREFGAHAELDPANLVGRGKFEISTNDVKITLAPENSYLIETRIIDGRRFILVPADEGVEVNGVAIHIGG